MENLANTYCIVTSDQFAYINAYLPDNIAMHDYRSNEAVSMQSLISFSSNHLGLSMHVTYLGSPSSVMLRSTMEPKTPLFIIEQLKKVQKPALTPNKASTNNGEMMQFLEKLSDATFPKELIEMQLLARELKNKLMELSDE